MKHVVTLKFTIWSGLELGFIVREPHVWDARVVPSLWDASGLQLTWSTDHASA